MSLVALVVALPAHAEEGRSLKGVALVIGQSNYQHIAALPNPVNDARDMVKLLTDLGFDARSVSDRDSRKLGRDLERFVEDAEGADVAFLYYSGHGIESAGENWLVPVDADVGSLENASETLVALSTVMDALKASVPVTVVLLDACRTNPFPAGSVIKMTPSGSGEPIGDGGLMPVRGAKAISSGPEPTDNLGTVIGFAAEPGRPALDGPAGSNSPYAAALLRHLSAMEGFEFGAVMRMVTEEVYLGTKAQQRPWVNESLRRLLYFGVAPEAPAGDEGVIRGERRTLLLTISELPDVNRSQVEMAAERDAVPLDALYGVLRALGTEKIPEDPAELAKILDSQAVRLKEMFAQRDALRTDDPEIVRLTASADQALREGAIVAARTFLDAAVARIEQGDGSVDALEEAVRKKRIADAAIYAQRAGASALAFDYAAAAADYGKAVELVARWDEKLRWNYANLQAESLLSDGTATGELKSLNAALDTYQALIAGLPAGDRSLEWARTRNNMAVVYQAIGERQTDNKPLEETAEIFRQSLAVYDGAKDDVNWALTQNNLGGVLMTLGDREADPGRLRLAVEAFRAALTRQDRAKLPLDWARTQNNLGIALNKLGDRVAEPAYYEEAERAFEGALEEYTRTASPLDWAMIQHNLGNIHWTIGSNLNDDDRLAKAEAAFRAALEVRKQDIFPVSWAKSRYALGNVLARATRFEFGTSRQEEAVAAYQDAASIYSRRRFPLEWAALQNSIGSVYQTIGQRKMSVETLEESASAFRAATRVYKRKDFPLDWAMAKYNLGNTTQLIGTISNDPRRKLEAAEAYRDALQEYTRAAAPRYWALAQSGLASALASYSFDDPDTGSLIESIAARRAALEVLTAEEFPIEWANAQNGLGTSLLNLGTRQQTDTYLAEAQAAFEDSLKIFTRADQPLQWAFGQNNLGDIYWNKAVLPGGSRADYERAVGYFELAKQGYAEGGNTMPVALTDQKIAVIRKALDKK